jgi:hypothetical protein
MIDWPAASPTLHVASADTRSVATTIPHDAQRMPRLAVPGSARRGVRAPQRSAQSAMITSPPMKLAH